MASCESLIPSQTPKKKQRCEGAPLPPSSFDEIEDPRSENEVCTYDEDEESDLDEDEYGKDVVEEDEVRDKEFAEYLREIRESNGFDVSSYQHIGGNLITPVLEDEAEDVKSYSQLALLQYNADEKKKLEFVKVLYANSQLVAGYSYYITFEARDPNAVDGRTITFQAKVWSGILEPSVSLCRPKPNRGDP